MRGRSNRTDHARDKFLEVLSQSCNITESAKAAGLARTTVYEWRADDESFAAAMDNAIAEATDKLEREAWRRAVEGYDEPIVHQGAITGTFKRYSDRMLEILLKGHKPEKYRERVTTEVTGRIETIADAELEAKIAALTARVQAADGAS